MPKNVDCITDQGRNTMKKILTRLVAIMLMVLPLVLADPTHFSIGQANDAKVTNSLGMAFVLVPAGNFTMGSPKEEPGRGSSETRHTVTISRPFYMQSTEVTVQQWQHIMGRRFFGGQKGSGDMPAVQVSWHDARKFIKRLNALGEGTYRLPTDAEWEYAARAGSRTPFSWGKEIDCSRAMYANNRRRSNECGDHVRSMGFKSDQPAPVKSYSPNAWGLFDMHGNVWEWCQDRFDPDRHWHGLYQQDQLTDPVVNDTGENRIRRGGSWFGRGTSCRSANRTYSHPGIRYKTTGFRLVRNVG